ncbi:MAG: HAMP domain-containing histidine kinase [Zoogloeaceae bacterium]|jgi:signal transduction histidine kinase|nr:HAMP domain-containing histidine kinase [Zoogloeaceae bacterium]
MASKQPFARRIVIAFVLMTMLVSGVFSLSIVAVVHLIEERLISEEMQRDLDSVIHGDLKRGHSPRLNAKTMFYASNLPEYAIPEAYKGLDEGFTELLDGDQAFYAYVQEINGVRYLLIQDQGEFEAHERALFSVVFAGFILAVLGAWGLGWVMAGRVMAPVSRLAQQVRHRDQLLPLAPPLAPEYPDDEVGQLAAAFDGTLGHLRQTLERERLFTSDVSHELRTPLMVIATSCELLQQAPLETHQREQLMRIVHASGEMRELAQIFLQLAREKAGEKVNESDFTVSVGLAQEAEHQCGHWRESMAGKCLDFECLVESEDDGRYNPTLLGTVMSNLLRNALHYTEHGHVRLILETGGFRVEDSGPGIPEDEQESIFQPFIRGSRARGARGARGEGLGLGLSLVKRICAHQGWRITVDNLPDGGSRFRVEFKEVKRSASA